MKAAKIKKKLKEMWYPPQKHLLKRKVNSITTAKTNASISQTSSECLKLTKEKFTLHEFNFGRATTISTIFYHIISPHIISLHITPWILILMLHIRQSNYLLLTNVLSTSFLMFHITFDEISTTLNNSSKGRWCTRYMWSNDMFVLWNCISAIFHKDRNTVYTSFRNSTLLFINGLIFDIINSENNQFLEF